MKRGEGGGGGEEGRVRGERSVQGSKRRGMLGIAGGQSEAETGRGGKGKWG